jgi:minimal PKS chain-length factor (CLF/KS beta)
VRGWGGAFDPSQGRDPARGARAVARAVARALAAADASADEVDAVWASASGSVAGDRAEAAGLAETFGGRAVPVTALKSMLGESLGASGALATVDLLETLRDGAFAGIAGLEATAPGFPLDVSAERRDLPVRTGLACAAGLDGQVCALLVGALR